MTKPRLSFKVSFAAGFAICLTLFVALVAANNAERARRIQQMHATGLGAVANGEDLVGWEPTSLWRQSSFSSYIGGVVGGVPGGVRMASGVALKRAAYARPMTAAPAESGAVERKIVRTAHLRLVVKDPPQAAESITGLARRLGGYTAASQVSGQDESRTATVSIRIPAERFEEARGALRGIALRVEDETIEASDVTKQYFDYQATLANYRAEEARYLDILRRASAVKDVLAVSEQLEDVRGRIHITEGEFRFLSQQIALASIEVFLRTETESRVAGLRWRPLFVLRLAVRDGLDSLADYVASMLAILLRLPAIALWVVTVLFAAKYAWRLLRWWWKGLGTQPAAPPQAP